MYQTLVITTECEYRQYVKHRLEAIMPVLAKAAVGNYNSEVPLPEEADDSEFSELYAGVQFMLEAIQEMMTRLQQLEAAKGATQTTPVGEP